MWWLGQAGFALSWGGFRMMVDPYLSEPRARESAGRSTPHGRMMPPPIQAEAVRGLDLAICSHAHVDHMDPDTLPALAAHNPACRFIVPAATVRAAVERGVRADRLLPMDDGDVTDVAPGVRIHALAAAHEDVKRDEAGHNHYLGFVIRIAGVALYHSGDCKPYPGLVERVRRAAPDVALLPINGRDAARTAAGIVGNFDFAEAVTLCRDAGIPTMFGHHFGMFRSNTVDLSEIRARIAGLSVGPRCLLCETGWRYEFRR
jgi:L-ascorbate metabolism protein UlaG (beta-lactamase superfamily)